MNIAYPVIITPEQEGGFFATFPDLFEAITQGETYAETLDNAVEVLTLTLEGRLDEGMDIPFPPNKKPKNSVWIAPSLLVQTAIIKASLCR